MPVTSKTLSAARIAIGYITVGALILVWSGVYYLYERNHGYLTDAKAYWCYGFLLTGAVVLLIGLLLGPIGQSVRRAEVAAPEAGAPAPVPPGQAVGPNGLPVTVAAPGVAPGVQPMTPMMPVAPATSAAPPPVASPSVPPR